MVHPGPCQLDQFRPLFKHIDSLARTLVPNAINNATRLLSNISCLSGIECNLERSWATLDKSSRPQSHLQPVQLEDYWANSSAMRSAPPATIFHHSSNLSRSPLQFRSSRWTFFYIGAPSPTQSVALEKRGKQMGIEDQPSPGPVRYVFSDGWTWAQPAHEIPWTSWSVFKIDRGNASDFSLLKCSLDNVLESKLAIGEQYDYDVLFGQLKLLSAINFAKSFMHNPKPYTHALEALQVGMGSRDSLSRVSWA